MAVGKDNVEGSEIVDFGNGWPSETGLSWVTTIPTGNALTPGILIYDTIQKKVMYYNGSTWVDLSIHTGAVNLSKQNAIPEGTTEGRVIEA